jgi:hypothetical protein
MSEEKEGKAMVGGWGLIDRGRAAALPRSLHCATRRTQTVRKKKPGRSGRDDRKGSGAQGLSARKSRVVPQWRPGRKGRAPVGMTERAGNVNFFGGA